MQRAEPALVWPSCAALPVRTAATMHTGARICPPSTSSSSPRPGSRPTRLIRAHIGHRPPLRPYPCVPTPPSVQCACRGRFRAG
jgi:hypothetical protein